MAMMVSPEVAKLFQVLTGEEFPDANEDDLRALAMEWQAAAQALGSSLGPGLRNAIATIRQDFVGEAEQAFAQRLAPFVEGSNNYIDAAAELFGQLGDYLEKLALDVEYMKLVTIYSLVALLAEIAFAIAMSPFTGGATMAWLAARMAIVRFLLKSLLGKLLLQLIQAAVFSVAFQLLIDVAAQATQYAMGTRHEWNTDHTKNAAAVGAMGAALAPILGGFGKLFSGGITKFLDNAFANKFGKNWQHNLPDKITEIGVESLHETLTEGLYKLATEGEFELNPYAASSGAVSGAGSVIGTDIGNFVFDVPNNGAGNEGGAGGGARNGPPLGDLPGAGGSGSTGSTGDGARGLGGGPGGGPGGSANLGGGPTGGPGGGPAGGPAGGVGGGAPGGGGPAGVGGNSTGGAGPFGGASGDPAGVGGPGQQGGPNTFTPTDEVAGGTGSGNNLGNNGGNAAGTPQPNPSGSGQVDGNNSGSVGGNNTVPNTAPPPVVGQDQPIARDTPDPTTSTATVGSQSGGPGVTSPATVVSGTGQADTNQSSSTSSVPPPANVGSDRTDPITGDGTNTSVATGNGQNSTPNQGAPLTGDQTGTQSGLAPPPADQFAPPAATGTDQTNTGAPPPTITGTDPINQPNTPSQQPPSTSDSAGQFAPPPVDVSGTGSTSQSNVPQQPPSTSDAGGQVVSPVDVSGNGSTSQSDVPQKPPSISDAGGQFVPPPQDVRQPAPPLGDVSGGGQQQTQPENQPPVTNQPVVTQPPGTNQSSGSTITNTPTTATPSAGTQASGTQLPGTQTPGNQQTGTPPVSTSLAGTLPIGRQPPGKQPATTSSTEAPTEQPLSEKAKGKRPVTAVPSLGGGRTTGTSSTTPTSTTPTSNVPPSRPPTSSTNPPASPSTPAVATSSTTNPSQGNDSASPRSAPARRRVTGAWSGFGRRSRATGNTTGNTESYKLSRLSRTDQTTQNTGTQPSSGSQNDSGQNNQDDQNNPGRNNDQNNQNNDRNATDQLRRAQDAVTNARRASTDAARARGRADMSRRKIEKAATDVQRAANQALGAVIAAQDALDTAIQLADTNVDIAQANRDTAVNRRQERRNALNQAQQRLGQMDPEDQAAVDGARAEVGRLQRVEHTLDQVVRTAEAELNRATQRRNDIDTSNLRHSVDATRANYQRTRNAFDDLRTAHQTANTAVTGADNHVDQADNRANAANAAMPDVQTAAAQVNTANTNREAAENRLTQANEQVRTLTNERDGIGRQIQERRGQLDNQVSDIDQRISELDAQLDPLPDQIRHLQDQIQQQQQAARAAQNQGRPQPDPQALRDNIDRLNDLTGQRDRFTEQRGRFTGERDELTEVRNNLPNRGNPLGDRLGDINETDLPAAQRAVHQATGAVNRADRGHRNAVDDLTRQVDAIVRHQQAAERAATAAAQAPGQAAPAEQTAEQAVQTAKDAAKKGAVERALAMLSLLPFDSTLTIETLGRLDGPNGLVDAIATATGQNAADVRGQITALDARALAQAINDGRLTIDTPNGPIDVALSVDLHRPDDPNAQHQRPAATKELTLDEDGKPLSESGGRSLPVRIPLLFFAPIDAAALTTVVRPTWYVGVTGKRAQNFDSYTMMLEGVNTGDRTAFAPTTMSITARVPNGEPTVGRVDVGLRLPDFVPGRAGPGQQVPLAADDAAKLNPKGVRPPASFIDQLGVTPSGTRAMQDLMLAQHQQSRTVDVDGNPVTVTATGQAQFTYAGTNHADRFHLTTSITGGSTKHGLDAVTGVSLLAGGSVHPDLHIHAGVSVEFSTGLSEGSTYTNEKGSSTIASDDELVYRVDRQMRIDQHPGTVSGTVQVPAHVARALGLPLPPHLTGSTPTNVPTDTNTNTDTNTDQSQQQPQNDQQQPNPQRRNRLQSQQRPAYILGKDDIRNVRADDVVNLASHNVSTRGRTAIEAKFDTPRRAKNAIYNATHGFERVTWQEDGRTHVVDIYARVLPPNQTHPSNKLNNLGEDRTVDQFGRVQETKRSAKFTPAVEFREQFTDDPGKKPSDPFTRNPSQSGPTQTNGLPKISLLSTSWESGHSNKAAFIGRDHRSNNYDGAYRDFDGDLDMVVVHRSTANPNWAQRFFLGGRMFGGPDVDHRLATPSRADIDQALSWPPNHQPPPNQPAGSPARSASWRLESGRLNGAVQVTTAQDKLAWATTPIPNAQMQHGLYVGQAPPASGVRVDPNLFGEFTNLEDFHVTPNAADAVHIALAKNVKPALPPAPVAHGQPGQVGHAGPDAPVVRKPPRGSGNWSSWGRSEFTDSRTDGTGTQSDTTYRYKHSELTRPDTVSGDAVHEFISHHGARGLGVRGITGRSGSTGPMVQTGALSDFNGKLTSKPTYYSPRVIATRTEGTLRSEKSGEHQINANKSSSLGIETALEGTVMPSRTGKSTAFIKANIGHTGKRGKSTQDELTSNVKQGHEYKGPTAFVAVDVRQELNSDLRLHYPGFDSKIDQLPVTVDTPAAAVVEMPVQHAVDMLRSLNLDVPPELEAMVPNPKAAVTTAQTLVGQGNGFYASFGDTSVINSHLDGNDPLAPLRTQLDVLGVTDPDWRADVLDRVDAKLNSPAGQVWLRDVLAGGPGRGGVISVPNSNLRFEDVVDIRVTATPANTRRPQAPAVTQLVPDKQASSTFTLHDHQEKKNSSHTGTAGVEIGLHTREVTPTVPGPDGPDGKPTKGPSEPGGSVGQLNPGASITWTSKTEQFKPGSGATKLNTEFGNEKIGRDSHAVDYQLVVTRRRNPMPGVDAATLGAMKRGNWDNLGGAPVTLPGSVDLIAPDRDVSPPLPAPQQAPAIQVTATRPHRTMFFEVNDGFRIEALGTATVNAVHDGVYAQMSNRPLPVRDDTAASSADIAAAVARPSGYTRPGSVSELALHAMTSGTSMQGAGPTMFTSDNYTVDNVVGQKHTWYDSKLGLTMTADFDPRGFRLVPDLPPAPPLDLNREAEVIQFDGETHTVSTTKNLGLPGVGVNSHDMNGPAPVIVGTAPSTGAGGTTNVQNSTFKMDVRQQGTGHRGRSYLFTANADFYADLNRYGSNWTAPQQSSVVKVSSVNDMHVRVWEGTALDKGLITINDVWRVESRTPPTGLTVVSTPDGSVIHRDGDPQPARVQPGPGSPRGRNLQVGPGVTQQQVVDFLAGLPADMRPATYTFDPTSTVTADGVRDGVAAGDRTADTTGVDVQNIDVNAATAEITDLADLSRGDDSGNNASTSVQRNVGRHLAGGALGGSSEASSSRATTSRSAGQPHTDALAGPWQGTEGDASNPNPDQPARAHGTAEPPGTEKPAPGKRSRDEFEADEGPVTVPEPPRVRPMPERLVPPPPSAVDALAAAVPPGTRFADPASFVELINGSRADRGRDVNCVDASLAFHSTYHGNPRVAGSAANGPPASAATAAAEELSYAPELFSRGAVGLGEIIERISRGGHGADAVVFGFPKQGRGHSWNVVNHDGNVSIVDSQAGTVRPATPDAIPGLDRVYAIPLKADNEFITDVPPAPPPDEGKPDGDPYAAAEHRRAVEIHELRVAAATGEEIPVPGTNGRLVPSLGGLRLVGAKIAAHVAAELSGVLGRDIVALVIGPDDAQEPQWIKFVPRGRPLPVRGDNGEVVHPDQV